MLAAKPQADGGYVRVQIAYCVVYRKPRRHLAARTVDLQHYCALGFGHAVCFKTVVQVLQLADYYFRHARVNHAENIYGIALQRIVPREPFFVFHICTP